jgi:hypothetical protein
MPERKTTSAFIVDPHFDELSVPERGLVKN